MTKIKLKKQEFPLKCKDPSTYESCEPYEITLNRGKYLFDCFGASSSYNKNNEFISYGAHVAGVLILKEKKTFYIYVGGQGRPSQNDTQTVVPGGYNGGGNGGYGCYLEENNRIYPSGSSGGGASDIRTIRGAWNSQESLESRIIVAGGAGGYSAQGLKGGNGGDLIGEPATERSNRIYYGGNQTNGYKPGIGQDGKSKSYHGSCGAEGNGGSGGGWYGGYASQNEGIDSNCAGSGGSSFISGYKGLKVINSIEFSFSHMEDGSKSHHFGDGLVTITTISNYTNRCSRTSPLSQLFLLILTVCS